ncbi:MAG: ester cyclase [Myxococcales bacterium]|nr:ester cyclase [Myxococcales bacterium]
MNADNEQRVRLLFENGWHLGQLSALMAPDFRLQTGGREYDLQGTAWFMASLYQAMPDLSFRIDMLFSSPESVAVRSHAIGTFTQPYEAEPEVVFEPTGESVQWTGITLFQFRGAQAVFAAQENDAVSLLSGMGLL